jgi:hypothetical protein
MKRLVALMIIIFFAVAVLPVFAADEPKASPTPASGTQQAAPTKSMFQKGGEEVGCFSKKCENVTKEITKEAFPSRPEVGARKKKRQAVNRTSLREFYQPTRLQGQSRRFFYRQKERRGEGRWQERRF